MYLRPIELSIDDKALLSHTMGLHPEEIYFEQRKGVAQCFYIFELDETVLYFCDKTYDFVPVPKRLHGTWRMVSARDLDYIRFDELLRTDTWVRCAKVPVTTYEYEIFYVEGK